MSAQMMLETKRCSTILATILHISLVLLEMLLHVQPILVDVEKGFVAERTNFQNVLDMHEFVQLLLNFASRQSFPTNAALEGFSRGG